MKLESCINELLENIITDQQLPKDSLFLTVNLSTRGSKEGEETSKSLCMYEREYPYNRHVTDIRTRSYVVMNIKHKTTIELQIGLEQFKAVEIPFEAQARFLKSSPGFALVVFQADTEGFYDYVKRHVLYSIDTYQPKHRFGCCNLYLQCSDARTCLHENRLYSKGCSYRVHLEAGRIFYGVNRIQRV